MHTAYKYVTIFEIPGPFDAKIKAVMDRAAKYTGLAAPYFKLPPHVTLHKPIEGVSEETIQNLVRSMALQVRKTRMVVKGMDHFGKHFMVLRVHATRSYAALWTGINDLLTALPEYDHGSFDFDNTLHISIAEKTTPVFDAAWPKVKKIQIESMEIPVESVSIYRKPVEGGLWERWRSYKLST